MKNLDQGLLFQASAAKKTDTTPPSNGSITRIWLQDPSVKSLGTGEVLISESIQDGPRTRDIVIKGFSINVAGDRSRNFLFDPTSDSKKFDAVHTLSVVYQVLEMYRRALKGLGENQKLKWQWGSAPLEVYPHAGKMENAYYSREDRVLKFFYFNSNRETIYTCRSLDIVAHETGHAVLDALRPGYFESSHPQTGGLHEAFGDITAIFLMLSNMQLCHEIIVKSKCNLHEKMFFSELAEQFGKALGRTDGLRNADNDLKLSEVDQEVHAISQVFTGAIYDIIADMFRDDLDLERTAPMETLLAVGNRVRSLLTLAILKGPEKEATFEDIANKMIELASDPKWKAIIRDQFSRREVLGAKPLAKTEIRKEDLEALSFKNCTCTLSSKEYQDRRKKAVADRFKNAAADSKTSSEPKAPSDPKPQPEKSRHGHGHRHRSKKRVGA